MALRGVTNVDQPPNLFDTLPIETVQDIAELLDSDSALCSFHASCRSAHNAVDADNFSFWRRRFIARFEPTGWSQRENIKYKNAYQHRRKVLKNGATFREGRSRDERESLELIRELIVGSFTNKKSANSPQIYASPNITHLVRFLQSTNILKTIFKPTRQNSRHGQTTRLPRPDPLLHTVQVICAPILLSFDPHIMHEHFGFPDSQYAVYSSASTHHFFGGRCGLDINMELVLHNINFWKYHMVRAAEQTLFTAFAELAHDERPQWWTSMLRQGKQELGKWWKGSYAYLDQDEICRLRERKAADEDTLQIQDIFAGEDAAFSFQNMHLEVIPDEKMAWPAAFERHLRSLAPPAPTSPAPGVRTRAQKRSDSGGTPEEISQFKPLSFRFDGSGEDSTEAFLASGWLNPLPPQQGIPGWQRLTMMKYFDEDEAGAGVYGANVDWNALWAYEGVVLPGGKIVVGRWWSPSSGTGEEQYSGPFILWCVDGAAGYGEGAKGEQEL